MKLRDGDCGISEAVSTAFRHAQCQHGLADVNQSSSIGLDGSPVVGEKRSVSVPQKPEMTMRLSVVCAQRWTGSRCSNGCM